MIKCMVGQKPVELKLLSIVEFVVATVVVIGNGLGAFMTRIIQ